MEKPKVLVAAPTYKGMKYCHDEFFSRIKSLTYPNYDILIVDNTEDESYFTELKKDENLVVIKDDTKETKKMARLISSRNKIAEYALKNDYEYVLMLDSDVIPPENIIEELLNCNKDLASGIYFNYFMVDGKLQIQPVAWKQLTEEEFKDIKKKIDFPSFVKSNLDVKRHLTREEVASNKLLEVLIPSGGCLLIKRKVFEKIRYGLANTEEMNNIKTTDDIYFALQARKKGFESYCYTKVKCKHLISKKFRKEGKVYSHPIFE